MDPITQGLFGAVAAQTTSRRATLAKASLVGALAGMAPDLDILIRSADDSLLALEYHRHFTHSLFFIPIGGSLCGLLLFLVFGRLWKINLTTFMIWGCVGYATHGLLDGCTTYGTRLLWPLSDTRFAWDLVPVIDPLFTLILLLITVFTIKNGQRFLAYLAISWICLYFSLAAFQHQRAIDIAISLAESRSHTIHRIHAKPSFGNILLWKTIYESNQRFYIDAVKPGLISATVWNGESIDKLNLERDFSWVKPQSQHYKDIERFRAFSDNFLAVNPQYPNQIADIRYSLLPHSINPLWGIKLFPNAELGQHVLYVTQRDDPKEAFKTLINMIFSDPEEA